MGNFRLHEQDEFPHSADASSNFNESVYSNAFGRVGGRPMGGWMRLGNRVNEGYAELSVCLYLPDGRIACQFQRPEIKANDRFNAGGLKFATLTPFSEVEMSYEGQLLLLNDPSLLRDPKRMFVEAPSETGVVRFRHKGKSPMHGGEPTSPDIETMYGRDFSLGHFNQHMQSEIAIRIGPEEWNFSGAGWRDHSWGPRYWQSIYYYRLFIANFSDGRACMLLRITDEKGNTRSKGVLLVDGEYEEILGMNIATQWTDEKEPARIVIETSTARRKCHIEGEIINLAPLRNRRKVCDTMLISRVAEGFTRFKWDGAEGLGITEYIERVENGEPVGYPL